jgi:hypothetical protein
MNVARFAAPGSGGSDGYRNVDGSVGSSNVYNESSNEADAKSTGSSRAVIQSYTRRI